MNRHPQGRYMSTRAKLRVAELRTKRKIQQAMPNVGTIQRILGSVTPARIRTPVLALEQPQRQSSPKKHKQRVAPPKKAIEAVYGQREAITQLQTWMHQFTTQTSEDAPPRWPMCMLHGKCGTGKTSAAHAICRDAGFHVVEVNASDIRSHKEITDYLVKTGFSSTFRGPTAILFDEIDGAHCSEKNSIQAIVDFMKRYKHVRGRAPILSTCNSSHLPILKPLDPYLFKVQFHKLFTEDMKLLAHRRNPQLSARQLGEFSALADGDARQLGMLLTLHELQTPGQLHQRDATCNIFDVCKAMLSRSPRQRPDIGSRYRTNSRYGTAIVSANYPAMCTDMAMATNFAEQMSDHAALHDLGWQMEENPADDMILSLTKLFSQTCKPPPRMLFKPDGRYFQPMSKKIANKRYSDKAIDRTHGVFHRDLFDAHYIRDCL